MAAFGSLHFCGLVIFLVVHPQDVQHTMHDHEGHFVIGRFGRLGRDNFWTDHDVAQQAWLGVEHVIRRVIERKRQDIRRAGPVHVLDVERRHLVDVDEGEVEFAGSIDALGCQHIPSKSSPSRGVDAVRILLIERNNREFGQGELRDSAEVSYASTIAWTIE